MHHEDCHHLLGHLSDYLDGEASQALCNEIEHHLADCEKCRVVIDTLRKTVMLYQDMPQPDMPEDARERLYASLDLAEYFNQRSE